MPYNEALAERVRRALAGTEGLTEKKMFGGIAFLVDGAICIGVDKDDLIVRCAKDETDALLAKEGVREFDLSGGRPMKGLAAGRTGGNRNGGGLQDVARLRSRPGAATSEDREQGGGAPPQNTLKWRAWIFFWAPVVAGTVRASPL